MSYKKQEIRETENIREFIEAANRELDAVEKAMNAPGRYPVSTSEPTKPRPGTTVYADGDNWDPGQGEGLYIYTAAGAWQKLEYGQPLSDLLTQISELSDPGVDAMLFWDDNFGEPDWLIPQLPLRITNTSFSVDSASRTAVGVVEEATEAEIFAATDSKFLDAGHLSTAAVSLALSDASTIAINWTAAINFTVAFGGPNRVIGNPTNGIPGTYRKLIVRGDDSSNRAFTFGNQYLGELPAITDATSSRWYSLYIECIASNHFAVSAKRVRG